MPIRFVLDENLRGPLWRAILRHNASGGLPIDATRVGGHLADRLDAGGHAPGVLLIRPGASMQDVLEALELVALAGGPADSRDLVAYIP